MSSEEVLAGIPEFESRPVIEEPDLPVLWPHEAGGAIQWNLHVARESRIKPSLAQAWAGNAESLGEVAMRHVNGEGLELLAQKYFFIQVVQNMGYRTPRQVLLSSSLPHGVTLDQAVQLFPNPEESIICKPHNGAGGMGIVEMKASDLYTSVDPSDDIIVQERVEKELEVRYVRQVQPSRGRILRVYDEKTIPTIEGDGTSAKWPLITKSDIPITQKLATAALNWKTRNNVVPERGFMHVSVMGVPPKDVLEWESKREHRVANMDRFMKQFLTDLQTEVGQELPQVCFDIGITDLSVLDGEYDFERMKECVVPFEFQMVFGANGYVWRSTRYRRRPEKLTDSKRPG